MQCMRMRANTCIQSSPQLVIPIRGYYLFRLLLCIQVSGGRAKTEIADSQIKWKLADLGGGQEQALQADVHLISTVADKEWAKPPIRMTFDIPSFTASGLRVRFFSITEAQHPCKCSKWVRYATQSGNCEVRME